MELQNVVISGNKVSPREGVDRDHQRLLPAFVTAIAL